MKKGLVAALIVIACITLFVVLRDDDPEITHIDSDGTAIVAFGDSLVEGIGAKDGQDFPSVLSRRIGEDIVNLGKSGDTTLDGLKRIDQVLALDPKVVIVLLGGNDALRFVDVEDTFNNLRSIVLQIQEAGSAVLLVGVQGGVINDKYKSRFQELAKDTGSALVPDILDGVLGKSEYMSDPIHPNEDGYRIMADRIEPELRRILGK